MGRESPRRRAKSEAVAFPGAEAFPGVGVAPISIPLREILPWAAFIGLFALLIIDFIGAEQGALSVFSGHYVHELVHDGRHILGFPCH